MQLEQYILPYYGTIAIAGFIAAIICPRLPPLSWKPDTYFCGKQAHVSKMAKQDQPLLMRATMDATERAERHPGLKHFLSSGVKNIVEMWLGVIPVVLTIGTTALVIAEYTEIFRWLSLPVIPILDLLGIAEAERAAQSVVVGFADMFLPAILASDIQSDQTRFIVAALSVTQLIFMSEVGSLLLGLKIPLKIPRTRFNLRLANPDYTSYHHDCCLFHFSIVLYFPA